MAISPQTRKLMARFARSPRTRVSPFSETAPSRFEPTQVTNPISGEAFTEAGAWEAIADYLDGDGEIEEKVMDKPLGKKGYVFFLEGANRTRIYVKLQNGGDVVICRSFHISDF